MESAVERPPWVQFGGLPDALQQPHTRAEEAHAERSGVGRLHPLRILAEELEVAAEVEDAEVLLVAPRPEEIRTEPRAAPDHLPELDPGVDRLEEDEIRDLGDVDARVQHIHGDGDVRRLVGLGEVVDQTLRISGVVVDHAREAPRGVRVVRAEASFDELRMLMVPSEENRLGEPVAALHRMPALHQVPERLVRRIAVEEPAVHRRGVHPLGKASLLRFVPPVQALPLRLLFVRQGVVDNPFAGKLQLHLPHLVRHEETVGNRRLQLVGVGRYPRLQLEEVVGVLVHIVARRRRQPYEQRIEVAEDRPVLLVDRTVGLVDDHEVEVPRTEACRLPVRRVDQPHHRRIGADEDAPSASLSVTRFTGLDSGKCLLKAFTA